MHHTQFSFYSQFNRVFQYVCDMRSPNALNLHEIVLVQSIYQARQTFLVIMDRTFPFKNTYAYATHTYM